MNASKLRTAVLALAAILVALALAAPAQASIIQDVQKIFEGEKKDPYQAVHARFVEQARLDELAGNLLSALENLRIALTIVRNDRASLAKARELKGKIDAEADTHFVAAKAALDKGDAGKAKRELIICLRLNPEHPDALDMLKKILNPDVFTYRKVKEGETIASLAKSEYENPGAELLITRVNGLTIADKLKPGQSLRLPIVQPALRQVLAQDLAFAAPVPGQKPKKEEAKAGAPAAEAVAPAPAPAPVQVNIAQPQGAAQAVDVAPLLSMAKLQFTNGLYETVISLTDEVLAAQPGNSEATALQQDATYQMATDLAKRGSNIQAVKAFLRLPKGFKDTGKQLDSTLGVLHKAAEPVYLEGVKYFIAEDLQKAVETWERALQMDPWHPKAQGDLQKAKQLLEKVRGG
jgi:tetratricopeptide (TPR) repeat protein